MRMPASFLPSGSQTTEPLAAGRDQASLATGRDQASLATGRPATIRQILPPGRDLAGSVSAGRRGRLGDRAGESLRDWAAAGDGNRMPPANCN
jgi:hypothetical protein